MILDYRISLYSRILSFLFLLLCPMYKLNFSMEIYIYIPYTHTYTLLCKGFGTIHGFSLSLGISEYIPLEWGGTDALSKVNAYSIAAAGIT